MTKIHCHTCGGVIADPTTVSYRLPDQATAPATLHTATCGCALPIVYGPPAGYLSWPGLRKSQIPIPK